MPKHRMGDLTPTALGERLLPSELHLDSLRLELRGPDGLVIPTEWIDVRDAEFAAAMARDNAPLDESLLAEDDDPEIQAVVEHDYALIKEWNGFREPSGFWDGYDGEAWGEGLSYPRYQIQVRFMDDSAIP